MPAPAVIPAPRAYINAVAVKGFVVELWVEQVTAEPSAHTLGLGKPAELSTREHIETIARDWNPRPRMQCMQGAPVVLTVTKEA